jgi:type IV pilus assembly protein PilC
MGHFTYQGQCQGGTSISGTIEAKDTDAAIGQLESMRIRVIEVEPAKRPKPKRGVGYDDFIFFNDQLASLAESGLALDQGLREIAADMRSQRLRRVVRRIADDLERGKPLDEAVAAHESSLPILYSRVIRAGIESNQLSATLLNLSQHLGFLSASRRLVIEALSYPVMIFLAALGIFAVIALHLIPQFEDMFEDFNTQLPALTNFMFRLAHAFPWLLGGAGVLIASAILTWVGLRATSGGRRARERALQWVPVVGPLIRTSLHARFLRAASLAVNGGIPLPEAMRLAAGATGSAALTHDAECAARELEAGESVGDACAGSTWIPAMFAYVADIASARGDLPDALRQLAKAMERRAAHHQGILQAWLLPAAVVLVAGGVGLCIIAMFLPLVTLIQSVSGG